jgi:ElaB/YqjD/DUF883 family membrane-anchored ribosome-binding protein
MAIGILRRSNTKVGVETLRDDIQKLTEDFRGILYSAGEQGKEKITNGSKRLGSALRTLGESAKSGVNNTYERISDQSKEAVEKSRKTIVSRPIASVLAALAAGLVVGMVIKR